MRAVGVVASAVLLLLAVLIGVGLTAAVAVAGLAAVVAGFAALVGAAGTRPRGRAGLLAVLVVGGVGASLGSAAFAARPEGPPTGSTSPSATAAPASTVPTAPTSAAPGGLALLAALPVVQPRTAGYARSRFGETGTDPDGDGCGVRDAVLRRDLVDRIDSGCRVLSGRLPGPDGGRSAQFVRDSPADDSVRVVRALSLRDAWRSGAWSLPAVDREALAQDPLGLLAVDAADRTGTSSACRVAARRVALLQAYRLGVTRTDRTSLRRVLRGCPAGMPGPAPSPQATTAARR